MAYFFWGKLSLRILKEPTAFCIGVIHFASRPMVSMLEALPFHRRLLTSECILIGLTGAKRESSLLPFRHIVRRRRGPHGDHMATKAEAEINPTAEIPAQLSSGNFEADLALEFLRVAEEAAIASAKTMGQGDRKRADQMATESMRSVMDSVL